MTDTRDLEAERDCAKADDARYTDELVTLREKVAAQSNTINLMLAEGAKMLAERDALRAEIATLKGYEESYCLACVNLWQRAKDAEAQLAEAQRQAVPREPTEAMMQAAYEDWNNHGGAGKARSASQAMRERWVAMHDAATGRKP
jgi:hypothetical protein